MIRFLYFGMVELFGIYMAGGYRSLVDFAVRAGVAAYFERVDRAQVNKVLEVLWNSPVDRAVETTILFVLRQRARRELGDLTARLIVEGLLEARRLGGDPDRVKALASEFLGLFKWVFEATQRVRVSRNQIPGLTLEDYLRIMGFGTS